MFLLFIEHNGDVTYKYIFLCIYVLLFVEHNGDVTDKYIFYIFIYYCSLNTTEM
jgi:hypothetical protein